MTEESPPARLVSKIVIGYDLSALPPSLIRSFTLLRGRLARKRFKIEVVLRPLSQLPPDTDVLFVPAELVQAAHQVAPAEARVMPLNASTSRQPAYDELTRLLEAGQEMYALPVEEQSGRGVIVHYRGNERIG